MDRGNTWSVASRDDEMNILTIGSSSPFVNAFNCSEVTDMTSTLL